jgi:hypothetical protein
MLQSDYLLVADVLDANALKAAYLMTDGLVAGRERQGRVDAHVDERIEMID